MQINKSDTDVRRTSQLLLISDPVDIPFKNGDDINKFSPLSINRLLI